VLGEVGHCEWFLADRGMSIENSPQRWTAGLGFTEAGAMVSLQQKPDGVMVIVSGRPISDSSFGLVMEKEAR
jgi:hypothetical protein